MASRTFPLPLPLLRRRTAPAPGAATVRAADLRPSLRLVVLVVLFALTVGGGWWWVRDSPLVSVEEVRISGLRGPQSPAIRSALTAAATDMTTLNVREDALRRAVALFPVVADVTATGDFPHLLRIEVTERPAVAALKAQDRTIPVAADGTLLRGSTADGVATISIKAPPAGAAVRDPLALAQISILAAAPQALRERVTRMFTGARGMQAQLRDGPVIAFGAPDRLAAKWAALTAVLADPSSAGATLIDLTVPESPAAAGLEPIASAEADATGLPAATGADAASDPGTVTAPATTTAPTTP